MREGRPGARARRRFALAALLGLATALAGCGEGEDPRQALTRLRPVPSGQANAAFELQLFAVEQARPIRRVRVTAAGPVRSRDPRSLPSLDWAIAATGLGTDASSRVVVVDEGAFVRLGRLDFALERSELARLDAAVARGGRRGFAGLGLDPLAAVKQIRAAGSQPVAGAPTTRYTGTLDRRRVLDMVADFLDRGAVATLLPGRPIPRPPKIGPQARQRILANYQDPTFEVNIAGDGTLRRLALDVEFRVAPERRDSPAREERGTLSYDLFYARVGAPQSIVAPPGARPIAEFFAELRRRGGLPRPP